MEVYRIRNEEGFQDVMSDDDAFWRLTSSRAEALGDVVFPNCYISSPKDQRGNFFNIGSGELLFDNTALLSLESVLQGCGELHTVNVETIGTLFYYNNLQKIDALDIENTWWRKESDGSKKIILKHEFNASKLATAPCLFAIPQNRFSKLLTVTGQEGISDDFYSVYNAVGLSGLKFEKLWSTE